ncbi:hypothetical protein OIU84_025928 [Salix udensis]|uniref:Secreted protein n=1 Tax=Salix udensis TaxID=889485 RepID=A0AAD6KL73_9ROSI|nr:hypothetical protein OIU84_025928 [Salix udensis]
MDQCVQSCIFILCLLLLCQPLHIKQGLCYTSEAIVYLITCYMKMFIKSMLLSFGIFFLDRCLAFFYDHSDSCHDIISVKKNISRFLHSNVII